MVLAVKLNFLLLSLVTFTGISVTKVIGTVVDCLVQVTSCYEEIIRTGHIRFCMTVPQKAFLDLEVDFINSALDVG